MITYVAIAFLLVSNIFTVAMVMRHESLHNIQADINDLEFDSGRKALAKAEAVSKTAEEAIKKTDITEQRVANLYNRMTELNSAVRRIHDTAIYEVENVYKH